MLRQFASRDGRAAPCELTVTGPRGRLESELSRMRSETLINLRRGLAVVLAAAVLLGGALTLATHPAGADDQMPGCPLGSMTVCLMGLVEHFGTWRTTFTALLVVPLAGLLAAALLWWFPWQVPTLAVRGVRLRVRSPGGLAAVPERNYLRVNLAHGLLHPKRF